MAQIILTGATLLLLLPVAVLFAEVLLAVTSGGRGEMETTPPESKRPRLSVIVPAHNEEAAIADTLRSITPQLEMLDRLLVVADNCSDQTAAVAEAEGAEVISRADLARRGKGYALDFGVRHLESDAPDIVIIIDADCQVSFRSIDRIARLSARTMRPVQALYLMSALPGAAVNTRIAQFASAVKNCVRPAGLHRLGLPCQLMGTGMAFPWSRISTAALATNHIVEDLKLGIDLARAGAPPLFCQEALITSKFPISSEGLRTQRLRWEHGYLSILLSHGPRLLWDSITALDLDLMAMALDLCVPPLALLLLQVTAIWFADAIFFVLTKSQIPLDVATCVAALLALSVLLSWRSYGRPILSFYDLARALVYAIRKIPLYAKFIVARQSSWVRSKRDGETR